MSGAPPVTLLDTEASACFPSSISSEDTTRPRGAAQWLAFVSDSLAYWGPFVYGIEESWGHWALLLSSR